MTNQFECANDKIIKVTTYIIVETNFKVDIILNEERDTNKYELWLYHSNMSYKEFLFSSPSLKSCKETLFSLDIERYMQNYLMQYTK